MTRFTYVSGLCGGGARGLGEGLAGTDSTLHLTDVLDLRGT